MIIRRDIFGYLEEDWGDCRKKLLSVCNHDHKHMITHSQKDIMFDAISACGNVSTNLSKSLKGNNNPQSKELTPEIVESISNAIYQLAILLEKAGKTEEAVDLHVQEMKMKYEEFDDSDYQGSFLSDETIKELNAAYWAEEDELKMGIHPTQIKEKIISSDNILLMHKIQHGDPITELKFNGKLVSVFVKIHISDNKEYEGIWGIYDYIENIWTLKEKRNGILY